MGKKKIFQIFFSIFFLLSASFALAEDVDEEINQNGAWLLLFDNGRIVSWDRPISLSFFSLDHEEISASFVSKAYSVLRFYSDASGYDFEVRDTNMIGTPSEASNFVVLFGSNLEEGSLSSEQILTLKRAYKNNPVLEDLYSGKLNKLNSGEELVCGASIFGEKMNEAQVFEFHQGAVLFIHSAQPLDKMELCLDKFAPVAFGAVPFSYKLYEDSWPTSTVVNYGIAPMALTSGKLCRQAGYDNFLCMRQRIDEYKMFIDNLEKE